MTVTSNRFNIN